MGPSDNVVRCFVGGDAHKGEPPLDRILAQDYRSEGESSCGSLFVNAEVRFEFWLMACAPQAAATDFTQAKSFATARRIYETERNEIVYRDQYDGTYGLDEAGDFTGVCNSNNIMHQNNFTITTPLMDTDAARGFIYGVAIRILRPPGGYSPDTDNFDRLPRIKRAAGSFYGGGKTCNVIKNGMPKLTMYGLHLDNSPCKLYVTNSPVYDHNFNFCLAGVEDVVGVAGLPGALTNFGPDQMDIVRFTKLWEDYNPTAGRLDNIMLETWHPYREEYPGRSLVACDALNSKKYPPDPIRLSDAGNLELESGEITDESLAKAFVFNNIVDVFGPDTDTNIQPEVVCSEKPNKQSTDRSTWCEFGCILSALGDHCISEVGSEVYNAPVDIILWDFEGVVLFGPLWPGHTKDSPAITVLVYGNPVSAATKHTADVGSVFLDIPPNKQTRQIPTNGLNLLDISDFYDLAQDEFGCFNREAPTCPPRDHTALWVTCAVMTALIIIHHHSQKLKEHDSDGCVTESEAIDELSKENASERGYHDTTRIIAMSLLLLVPMIAFSPIILFFYIIAPRHTLYKLWHVVSGKEKEH